MYIFRFSQQKNAPLKQTYPIINFSSFGENKLCQLIRRMIGFILTKFQNFDFWVDFQLCSILTVRHSLLSEISNGYQFLSQPSLSNAGGAALYINNNLNFSIRPEFTATTDTFEALWIEVLNNCHSNVLCGILYRHPNGDLGQFIDYLSCVIDRINQENKTCIIMGDFNINLLKTRITFSN